MKFSAPWKFLVIETVKEVKYGALNHAELISTIFGLDIDHNVLDAFGKVFSTGPRAASYLRHSFRPTSAPGILMYYGLR